MDKTAKEGDQIAISAITLIEVVYLVEKGKIEPQHLIRLQNTLKNPDSIASDRKCQYNIDFSGHLLQPKCEPNSRFFFANYFRISAMLVVIAIDLDIALAVSHVEREQVPDMPDRIIAATAVHYDLPIISRDKKIQAANLNTIW